MIIFAPPAVRLPNARLSQAMVSSEVRRPQRLAVACLIKLIFGRIVFGKLTVSQLLPAGQHRMVAILTEREALLRIVLTIFSSVIMVRIGPAARSGRKRWPAMWLKS